MSEEAKETLRGHWRQVRKASGQPFGPSGLDAPGFAYDTDPAARAVVAFRRADPAGALGFLHAVQRAFHADGPNVTDSAVLADLAAGFGRDPESFAADLASDSARPETWRDYAIARGLPAAGRRAAGDRRAAGVPVTPYCFGASDQVVSSIGYGTPGVANNLGATSASSGPGNGSRLTSPSVTYDAANQLTKVTTGRRGKRGD
jgi:putative protein-disulfide isomerase